jgi:hypothetical protein
MKRMKHILTADQFLTESLNQMYVLYLPTDLDLKNRNYLPSRWDREYRMIATYPMIQDAVTHMVDEDLDYLYQMTTNARILTQNELEEILTQNGFDVDEIMDAIEADGQNPQKIPNLSDTLWGYDGFEIGDRVWIADLQLITKTFHAVQGSEIERIRKHLGI